MTFPRPDELASMAEIERGKKYRGLAKSTISTAASLGGYTQLAGKLLPFLNENLPIDIAMKGIKKFSPNLAKLLNKGATMGLDIGEGLEYIKDRISPKPEEKTSIFKDLIKGIDIASLPESQQKQLGFLQMAAEELEKKGVGPNDEPFKKLAKKIKDVLKGKTKVLEAEAMEMQPEQSIQPQQAAQQVGPGQQALMAILQKIQAQRTGGG